MIKAPRSSFIFDLIIAALVILFVYTAATKLWDYRVFRIGMSHSSIIGARSRWLAWLVPAAEILTATLLVVPKWHPAGFIASAALLVIFTAYILYMLYFSPTLPCHCGGVIQQMTWTQHVFFNLGFLACSLAGIFLYRRNNNIIAINRISRTPA